jgi:hypothetical protein
VTWSEADANDEQVLLSTLNTLRALGLPCDGGFGSFGGTSSQQSQAPALSQSPELRCAARRHARDMAQATAPAGETPEARMRLAGYASSVTAEVTARDLADASQVLGQQLTGGGDDCKALVDPRMVAVGVGKYQNLWTIDLAGARSP